jgi:hypothetical protein
MNEQLCSSVQEMESLIDNHYPKLKGMIDPSVLFLFSGCIDYEILEGSLNDRDRINDKNSVYSTGSRYYGTASEDSDFDYFGAETNIGTWAAYLSMNGWVSTAGGYNKSIYMKKGKTVLNLISVSTPDVIKWQLATQMVKSLLDNVAPNKTQFIKNSYVAIFESITNAPIGEHYRNPWIPVNDWPILSTISLMSNMVKGSKRKSPTPLSSIF